MASSIKIRAKAKGGVTTVKSLMNHPMETGQRKDKKGGKIPEHFIQEVVAEHGGKTVFAVALAFVVDPADLDLVAFVAAGELE